MLYEYYWKVILWRTKKGFWVDREGAREKPYTKRPSEEGGSGICAHMYRRKSPEERIRKREDLATQKKKFGKERGGEKLCHLVQRREDPAAT